MSADRQRSDWAFAAKLAAAVLVGAIVLATGWGLLVGVLDCYIDPQQPPAPPAEGTVVIDRLGRQVIVPERPRRIVAVPPVLPSLIYAVDPNAARRIVGMHPLAQAAARETILSQLVPEMLSARTGFVRGGFDVNAEELLRLEPDLVFHMRQKERQIQRLTDAGLTVVATEAHEPGLESYFVSYLTLLGDCFQKPQRAEMLIADLRSTAESIRSRAGEIPRDRWPRALILWRAERLMATGTGSFADYWLETTGARNVAAELNTPPMGQPVSMEQILAWQPEIIYLTNFTPVQPEDLYENRLPGQDWSNVAAVRNRRVYKIPTGLYRWYAVTPDAPLMLKWLAVRHHPELFDYDLSGEIRRHFRRVYDVQLTGEQVQRILQPRPSGEWIWD